MLGRLGKNTLGVSGGRLKESSQSGGLSRQGSMRNGGGEFSQNGLGGERPKSVKSGGRGGGSGGRGSKRKLAGGADGGRELGTQTDISGSAPSVGPTPRTFLNEAGRGQEKAGPFNEAVGETVPLLKAPIWENGRGGGGLLKNGRNKASEQLEETTIRGRGPSRKIPKRKERQVGKKAEAKWRISQ